jgi:hypothetical protein
MDSRQALAELQNFQKTRKSAGDYYSQYQDELGVGGAQQSANDVRSLIRNTETALRGVNASVAGRTRGNLVTEAQRARLEGLERAPIAEELGSLQGRYSDEMQNYRDLLGQATTRAGQAYQTDADRLAALESNYNKIYQAEQAAAEQARWERELAERQKQFQAEMAQRDRQFNANLANIRRQYAQQASIRSQDSEAAKKERERQAKLEAEAARIEANARAKANPVYQGNRNVVDSGGFGGLLKQGFQNIVDYGPLALFGGGSLWR